VVWSFLGWLWRCCWTFWGHVGWLMIKSANADAGPLKKRYAPDLIGDRLYKFLEVADNWIKVALLSWAIFFAAGYAAVTLSGGSALDAAKFGASVVVWGAAVRTVLVWHITWSLNSVTHLWGCTTRSGYSMPTAGR
jgi:fatty-acid desaturase